MNKNIGRPNVVNKTLLCAAFLFVNLNAYAVTVIPFEFTNLNDLKRPNISGLNTEILGISLSVASNINNLAQAAAGIKSTTSIFHEVLPNIIDTASTLNTIIGISNSGNGQEIVRQFSLVDTAPYREALAKNTTLISQLTRQYNSFPAEPLSLNQGFGSLFSKSAHDEVIKTYKDALTYNQQSLLIRDNLKEAINQNEIFNENIREVVNRSEKFLDIVVHTPILSATNLPSDVFSTIEDYTDLLKSNSFSGDAETLLGKVEKDIAQSRFVAKSAEEFANSDIVEADYEFSHKSVVNNKIGFSTGFTANNFHEDGLESLPRFIAGALQIDVGPDFQALADQGSFEFSVDRTVMLPSLLGGGVVKSSGTASVGFNWQIFLDEKGNYIKDIVSFATLGKRVTFDGIGSDSVLIIGSIASPFSIIDIERPDSPGSIEIIPEVPVPPAYVLLMSGLGIIGFIGQRKKNS